MALGGTAFDPTTYNRYIELLDDDLNQVAVLCNRATSVDYVELAKFTLLRQGGCGAGEFVLNRRFPGTDLGNIDLGSYIRCKYTAAGDPVYLGKVQELVVESPSRVIVRTDGPFVQFNDIQVGGFDSEDLRLPDLYAATDVFIYDPDYNIQSFTFANNIPDLMQIFYNNYISFRTNVSLGTIGTFTPTIGYNSSVFRGQENLSQIIRTMAIQQGGASYGVDANNEFFFIPLDQTERHTFQEGLHLTKLSKSLDRSLLYNRLIITGDYVYLLNQDDRFYRWVSAHASATSINTYGSRRLILYIPWIRSQGDADRFANGFFDMYAEPTTRYTVTTIPQGAIQNPWGGFVGLLDRNGADLKRNVNFDRCEVVFDKAPYVSFTTGPEDLQFPVAPEPNRWELKPENAEQPSFGSFSTSLSLSSSSVSSISSSSGPAFCDGECVNVLEDVAVTCESGELVVTKTFTCVRRCSPEPTPRFR